MKYTFICCDCGKTVEVEDESLYIDEVFEDVRFMEDGEGITDSDKIIRWNGEVWDIARNIVCDECC